MARNHRLRFWDNNLNDATTATITYSSQASATYAAANTRDPSRSKYWKPEGVLTTEWYELDLGIAYPVTAFAMIGPIDEAFQLGPYENVTIKADNIDDNWTTPAFSQVVTADGAGGGVFAFFDVDGTQPSYRFWRVEFSMANAPDLKISHIYFGDYVTLTLGNVAQGGFGLSIEDPSEVFQSESGQKFFNTRPKYRRFDSVEVQIMTAAFKREVEEMFYRLGVSETLYLSLDPTASVSATVGELTAYGRFQQAPQLRHVFRDYYSLSFSFEEAV